MSANEPREIAFEDIKKGDDIEARYVRGGVTFTRRGIAHSIDSHAYWYTGAGGVIASDYDDGWKHYLHSRPATEEPKGLGAAVRAKVSHSTFDPYSVRTLVRTANHDFPWVDETGCAWAWAGFDPDSIEVLSEGIGADS